MKFYRSLCGSQQVVKGDGPLIWVASEVMIGSTGSALSKSLNKSINQ